MILSDATASVAGVMPVTPVVWLSKDKVVVEQSCANLLSGREGHLFWNLSVRLLASTTGGLRGVDCPADVTLRRSACSTTRQSRRVAMLAPPHAQ